MLRRADDMSLPAFVYVCYHLTSALRKTAPPAGLELFQHSNQNAVKTALKKSFDWNMIL